MDCRERGETGLDLCIRASEKSAGKSLHGENEAKTRSGIRFTEQKQIEEMVIYRGLPIADEE